MKEISQCDFQSVTFSRPSVENVCSRHAGSILALDEPIVPSNPTSVEVAQNVFRAALEVSSSGSDNSRGKSTLGHVMIYDLLISAKLISNKHEKEIIIDLIKRIYSGPSDMDEKAFLDFISSFIAPSYYYGQRLRRNAGRGEHVNVTELIIRGCDANTGDGEGLTSLHYACEYDRVNIIDALEGLVGKALIINAEDKYGWTPLHCAAYHGSLECAEKLIKLGASVEHKNKVGKTALHLSGSMGWKSMCDLLLEYGGNLNTQDNQGMTAMHDVAFKGNLKLFRHLARASSESSSLSPLSSLPSPSSTSSPSTSSSLPSSSSSTSSSSCSSTTSPSFPSPIPIDYRMKDVLGYTSEDYLENFQYEFPPALPITK